MKPPVVSSAGRPFISRCDEDGIKPTMSEPNVNNVNRRTFLKAGTGLVGAALTGCGYMRYVEPTWFESTTRVLQPIPGLEPGLRILHLSDLHFSDEVPLEMIERAVDLALETPADLLLLTGDFITHHLPDEEGYIRVLRRLSDRMPAFACLGNHDGRCYTPYSHRPFEADDVIALLNKSGIRPLINEAVVDSVGGQTLRLIGLNDLWGGLLRPELCLSEEREDDLPHILLSHNPDSKDLLRPYQWDLMLSGHTHGGQLVVPFTGARPFAPVLDMRFIEGLHQWEGRQLHITRGIGNLHGMRINCRPELSLLIS